MAWRAAAGAKFTGSVAGDRRPRCVEPAFRPAGCALAWSAACSVDPSGSRHHTGAHLAAINLGLKTISVDRRRNRDRETRLLAIADGLIAAAEICMKEHDRLVLARNLMERKLAGRWTSSKLTLPR